jgi:hypothetical protein
MHLFLKLLMHISAKKHLTSSVVVERLLWSQHRGELVRAYLHYVMLKPLYSKLGFASTTLHYVKSIISRINTVSAISAMSTVSAVSAATAGVHYKYRLRCAVCNKCSECGKCRRALQI